MWPGPIGSPQTTLKESNMPIISQNPVTENGKVFDRLAVQLAISPVIAESDIGPSFAVQFSHYRKDEFGNIEKPESHSTVGFGYSSALEIKDPEVESAVREIMSIVGRLASVKGI